jgi:hypothetical protein
VLPIGTLQAPDPENDHKPTLRTSNRNTKQNNTILSHHGHSSVLERTSTSNDHQLQTHDVFVLLISR